MILRVVERAQQAPSIDRVIVATDDERVFQAVADAGVEVVMTSPIMPRAQTVWRKSRRILTRESSSTSRVMSR